MIQQHLVVGVRAPQAFDEASDSGCVGFVEAIFLQIQIVNDAADPADTRIGDAEARAKRFERTVAVVVAEFGVECVERHRAAGRRAIAELSARLENLLRHTSWRVSNIDYGAQVTFELPLGEAEIDPFRAWLSETTSGRCEAVEIGEELVEVPV